MALSELRPVATAQLGQRRSQSRSGRAGFRIFVGAHGTDKHRQVLAADRHLPRRIEDWGGGCEPDRNRTLVPMCHRGGAMSESSHRPRSVRSRRSTRLRANMPWRRRVSDPQRRRHETV